MTIRVSGSELAAVVSKFTKILLTDKLSNVGECLVLDAEGSKLKITGANHTTTLSIYVPLEEPATEKSTVLLPGKLFLGIASKLTKESVSMSFGRKAVLKTETDTFNLGICDLDSYPYLRKVQEDQLCSVTVSRTELTKAFAKVLFCVTGKDTAQSIAGAMVDFSDNEMKVIAVEHNMMAMSRIPCEIPETIYGIVSSQFALLLPQLIHGEGTIQFGITPKEMFVEDDTFKLIGRRLSRDFLPYKKVLFDPVRFFKTNRKDLINALNKAQLFTSKISNAQKFEFSKDRLTFEGSDPEFSSDGKIVIPGINEGGDVSFHFDSGDWIRAMSSFDDSEITIGFLGDHQRVRINEDKFTFIIQPILK